VRPAKELEASTVRLCHEVRYVNLQEKMASKFSVLAGFMCSRGPVAAAMLRGIIGPVFILCYIRDWIIYAAFVEFPSH
jgi:hypothetical protein